MLNTNWQRLGCALVGSLLMAACETTGSNDYPYGSEPSISIPYNPYDFDPDELQQEADAHCDAYGLSASYEDETIDPQSVRWRYRHYACI